MKGNKKRKENKKSINNREMKMIRNEEENVRSRKEEMIIEYIKKGSENERRNTIFVYLEPTN